MSKYKEIGTTENIMQEVMPTTCTLYLLIETATEDIPRDTILMGSAEECEKREEERRLFFSVCFLVGFGSWGISERQNVFIRQVGTRRPRRRNLDKPGSSILIHNSQILQLQYLKLSPSSCGLIIAIKINHLPSKYHLIIEN